MEQLGKTLSRETFRHLRRHGWVSVPSAVDSVFCDALREDIRRLAPTFTANTTRFIESNGSTKHLEKRGILEVDLSASAAQRQVAPTISSLVNDTSLRTMSSVFFPQLTLRQQSIKVQMNSGHGGCFPLHYDSDERVDSRKITAILYLNKEWKDSHAGQLRLYPHPAAPVDISPVSGTLVLFSACHMVHRVLPAHHERFCVTFWLYGTSSLPKEDSHEHRSAKRELSRAATSSGVSAGELAMRVGEFLMASPRERKVLYRYLLQEEWRASMMESHAGNAETTSRMEEQQAELAAIQVGLSACVRRALDLPSSSSLTAVTTALKSILDGGSETGKHSTSPTSWF